MSEVLTKSDYDILLLHVLKDPRTFLEFVTKTNEPVFDPAIYVAHDFIAKVVRDVYYEHEIYMPTSSMRFRLQDNLDDKDYDPEIKDKIYSLFDMIAAIPNTDLMPDVSRTILSRVIDEQVAESASERIKQVLERGNTTREAINEIQKELEQKRLGVSDQVILTNPFENISEHMIRNEVFATGVEFIDTMLNGGPWRHDLLGILAPSSGGKTTLAVQLATSWVRQDDVRHALIMSYEQPLEGDISSRLCSAATGIPVGMFRGKDFEDLTEDVREKLITSKRPIENRFHFADMSTGLAGVRGVEDIKSIMDQWKLPEEGPPTLVIIDWFMPCIQRAMLGSNVNTISNEALRMYGNRFMDDLKIMKNNRNAIFIINHQLNAEKAGASSNRKPIWTDAAEWKAFAWFFDVCFAVGTLSEDMIGHFCASKVRATAASSKLVRLRGDLVKFVSAENDFMTANGKIVPKVNVMDNLDNSGQHVKADVSHLSNIDNSAAAQFGD